MLDHYTKSQLRSEVKVFAAAFVLGEILYTIEGASAILVVIGEQLSLAMLSTTTDPSLYLDIPFGSVQDVEVSDTQSQSLSQMRGSQKPVQYCLKLNLRLTKANNYRLNAKSSSVDSITIVFDHPKDSRLVEDALSEYCELPQKGLLDRRMFGHTMPLDISLKQSLDSERDTYDTEALTYIASDAVDAMDEAQSNLEESAADAGTLNGHLHGRNPQSREEVSTISQTFKRDLPTNSTRLTTSHSGGRALVSRDYVDVSTHAQTMEDTSSSADEDNAVMQPKTLNTLGHSTDDAADIAHSNGDQRRGQLVAMRSSSDPLNTISPKRSTMNQESHRDPESLTGHTSMKQLHSQSHVADPKRPKLTQTMRDANGQSVAGVGEVTPKGSQVGYGRNNAERPPGRTKAGSVISKTARPEAQSRDEVAVHKKGLTATRKRVSPVQNQEEGVAKDRRIAKEARDHPGRTVAQGSSSQRLKIAVAPKPITTNTSSKKVAPSILPPKPQGKGKVPEVRKEKPTRDGVNYDEAFEVDNGAESSGDESNNKKTKAQKQQKASANQKKVKKPAAKKAPPTKKTQNIPPATRKPQRRAAVKANKAIQGIVEDDTAEQPNFEALIHLSPTAQRIPKDGQATTGDKKSGMRPPPINALSPPIRPAMTTPAVPKDRQGPSFTKQSPEQSLLYPAEVIDTVNFKTKPTVGPFIVDSTGETEHASSNSPPDAALEDPTKVVPSTLEMNTPLATNEDVYEVADSFPDKALATGSSQNPSLETAAPIQGMQPNHDQVPAKNTLDISAEAAEQHEVTEGKPDSSADHPEKFTGTNIQPKEHTVFLDNLEQNVRTLTVEGVTHNNAGQPTPFLEDETKNEPIILAPTTPNDAVLSIEPPDTHFEEAMTFVDPVDENILTSSLQRPLTKPGVEEVYRNGVGQPITTQDHPRNTSLPYPAQNIFTEETNKNGSFQVARKQDHPVKAAPLSLTAPTSIKKLKDALSSVPQMYTEAKERHEKPGILRKKVLDAPQVSQKRGREPEEATTGKRSRPFLLGDDIHRSRRQPNESPESTPKPVPKSVHRKPNLVHFEPTGPSNQGSSTKLRAASAQQFPAGQALHRVGEHNHKREHIGDVEDDSLELHQRPKKRPKTLHLDSPNRAAEHTPIQLKKSHKIVSIVQQRKPSSQSSRVDAFGSPQPFHHSRTTTLAPSYIAPHLTNEDVTNFDDAWEADENVAPSYDDVSPIPEMLLPPDRPAKAPPRFEPLSIISNNIKHRPSSPLASSSIIDDLTAHKEQPSGQFIDVRTANIIVPQKPQDPFFEATLERPNTFMELLRRSSDQHTRKDQGKQSDQLKFDRVAIAAEDPEKTLIGAQSPDRGDSSSSSSESSPGSDSSTPNGDELSDDENGLWTSSWRNALKSHQISTLEALIEISHVGRKPISVTLLTTNSASPRI